MKIKRVLQGSPAYKAGIKKGDSIIRINNYPILDKLSLIYAEKSGKLNIEYVHNGKKQNITIRKRIDTQLGIEVEDIIRRCVNKCIFCFERQLPEEARPELRLRDDDYTLSYATGSYITLTNLTDYDRKRIVSERFSPLYLSIHATDNNVRKYLLGNEKAPDILKEIEYFTSNGIEFHTQFVICPDINDGKIIEKSISDLEKFFPHILSISIVPVGLTRFRDKLPYIKPVSRGEARDLISMVNNYQNYFKKKYGKRKIYASDELFIIAGERIPVNAYYEDYPQYDNGVGLIRAYMEEIKRIKMWKNRNAGKKLLLITGFAFKEYLNDYAITLKEKFNCETDILPIKNNYFGSSVNVASLISFKDIIRGIKSIKNTFDLIVLPPKITNVKEEFIDNHQFCELKNMLKCDIIIGDESFKITTLRIIKE
ncbi:DUF512 domain-containing protein [candidate division TA06 bacterium]|uniref:DUF512 domain-containing protein n=1 Tax=candidate division TA06 bacterium TaxID=2250710 RepID=A0A660S951_UNCT6|nr:MAG: DUF512 domain-containing protein [candidate division TA06 bacterium]